jgi:hypothetical protein
MKRQKKNKTLIENDWAKEKNEKIITKKRDKEERQQEEKLEWIWKKTENK